MQLTYNMTPRTARKGMINTIGPHFIRTAINKQAASIPYGVAVSKKAGGDDNEYALPTAASPKVEGITVFEHNERVPANGVFNVEIADGQPFNLLEKGFATVEVEEAVTQGDIAYVRHTANGLRTQLGAFRKSDDAGTAAIVRGARYLTSAGAGGLALVEIDAAVDAGLGSLEASVAAAAAALGAALQGNIADAEDAFELRTKSVEINLDHAQAADTAAIKFFKAPAAMVVDSVDYINPAGLAEHADNYFTIAVKNGEPVVASKNTKAGEGGTLAADEFVALTNGDLAARTLAEGDVLALALTIAGVGVTLPAGRVVVHAHYV